MSSQLRKELGEFVAYLVYFKTFYNFQLPNGAVPVIDTNEANPKENKQMGYRQTTNYHLSVKRKTQATKPGGGEGTEEP